MFQKKSLFVTILLAGAWGLGGSPLWSQNIPGLLEQKKGPQRGQHSTEMEGRINLGLEAGAQAGTDMTSEDVKKVQEALKKKGYDPGPVDGVLGRQTQEALKSFQMASGLQASGTVNTQTAAKLGVDVSSSAEGSSVN